MHFHFHEKCRFVGISNEGSKCSNKGDQICEEDAQGISIGFLQLYITNIFINDIQPIFTVREMYSLVGSSVSWLHANLQVLSLCHCSILKQFPPPPKKWLKKRRKVEKKLRWYTRAYKFYPQGLFLFFFLVLRKPQKILPSFCVHMNGKVKQSSEKSKKAKNKKPSFLSMAEDSHRILVDLISKCSPAYSRGW